MFVRLCIASLCTLLRLNAVDLVVRVTCIAQGKGEVGCALYSGADGFPMDPAKASGVWVKAQTGSVDCRFAGLRPGTYALAVSHDLNGNRKTDTNFAGMPKEAWGVSNNVRPRLRAPRFDEARFEIKDGEAARLEVKIGR